MTATLKFTPRPPRTEGGDLWTAEGSAHRYLIDHRASGWFLHIDHRASGARLSSPRGVDTLAWAQEIATEYERAGLTSETFETLADRYITAMNTWSTRHRASMPV